MLRSTIQRLLRTVLLIADMFHPVNNLAILLLLDGDVRHARRRRSAVPMLFAWREPDDITGPDLLDWSTFALSPPAPGSDD
jgi:hypothetical protein